MNAEIPGYYFDPDKNRYFKIEHGRTAPADASWSATAVKRRKVEDKEAAEARRRLELGRDRIKRSRLLADPRTGGLLQRELGVVDPSLPAGVWAEGLRDQGEVPFAYPQGAELPKTPNLPCFYVDGSDENTGLGFIYATVSESSLLSCYVPTDEYGRISFATDAEAPDTHFHVLRDEVARAPDISCITYHPGSHKILLTSRRPHRAASIAFFSPPLARAKTDPAWRLGHCDYFQVLSLNAQNAGQQVINTCAPAPPASPLTCLLGGNTGILRFSVNGDLSWVAQVTRDSAFYSSAARQHQPGQHRKKPPTDTFSIDFQAGGHPSVFYAGGRPGKLWVADLRAPADEWSWLRHRSAVAQLRSLDEHHVLAAGPRSAMAIYDVRAGFGRPSTSTSTGGSGGGGGGPARPCLEFPEYRNAEHVHIGLAAERSLGVVAAAHDDGTVGLYSLHSGRRLRSPAVDAVAAAPAAGPVKCLQFQGMPGEQHPSLWMGVGPSVRKVSWGGALGDDEW